MMKLFITLLISTLLFSCGRKEGQTPTKISFSLGAILSGTAMNNGGKFFGKSDNGDSFMMDIPADGSDVQISLRNGTWNFYAIIWDSQYGGTNKFSGYVRCASTGGIQLTGGETPVDLNLANANCADTAFGPHYTYDPNTDGTTQEVRFPQLNFMPVLEDVAIDANNNCQREGVNAPGWDTCGGFSQFLGVALNYSALIPNFHNESGSQIHYEEIAADATCADVDSAQNNYAKLGGGNELSNFNYPAVLPLKLRVGYDGVCATAGSIGVTHEPEVIDFFNGGIANHAANFFRVEDAAVSSGTKAFNLYHKSLPEYVCGGARGTSNTVVGGRASAPVQPYAICNENQFNTIDSSMMANNFVLMENLFFDLGDQNLIVSGILFPNINFKPLGMGGFAVNNNGTPSQEVVMDFNGNAQFTGTFEGMGRSISGARFQLEENDQFAAVGIFQQIGLGGIVRNLVIDGVDIEVSGYVNDIGAIGAYGAGGLVGYLSGGTISNVTIYDPMIRVKNDSGINTGAVAGIVDSSSTLSQVVVFDGYIQGLYSTGGIAGYVDSSNIQKCFYAGLVEGSGATGGVVGSLNTSNITECQAMGTISENRDSTQGLYDMGGLVGYASAGGIENSISNMLVTAEIQKNNYLYIGGILGYCTSGCTIDRTFNLGKVYTGCDTGTPWMCYIGDMVGYAPSITVTQSAAINSMPDTYFGTTQYVEASQHISVNTTQGGSDFDEVFAAVDLSQGFISTWNGDANPVWGFQEGYGPYLSWTEYFNPCTIDSNYESVSQQVSMGRGSDADPIILCSATRFHEFLQTPTSYSYRLENPIYVADLPASSNSNYTGSFDGNGMFLTGGRINTNSNNAGIFPQIGAGGKVFDFDIIDFRVKDNDYTWAASQLTVQNAGVVTGINNGEIKDVNIFMSKVEGIMNVGGVAGQNNTGTISHVRIEGIDALGMYSVGGIAGMNNNVIEKSMVRGEITNKGTQGIVFGGADYGGIAGVNNGSLEQVHFAGKMGLTSASQAIDSIGGIAGENSATGTINDAIVGDPHSGGEGAHENLYIEQTSTQGGITNVGGIVGENLNTDATPISNVINISKTAIVTAMTGSQIVINSSIGQIVGGLSGSGNDVNDKSFYEHEAKQWTGHHYITSWDTVSQNNTWIIVSQDVSAINFNEVIVYSSSQNFMDNYGVLSVSQDSPSIGYSKVYLDSPIQQSVFWNDGGELIYVNSGFDNTTGSQAVSQDLMSMSLYCDDALTYVPGSPPSDPFGHGLAETECSNGWDMSQEFSGNMIGSKRVIDWYFYMMGIPGYENPSTTPPVWTIREGEEYPRLMQLDHK